MKIWYLFVLAVFFCPSPAEAQGSVPSDVPTTRTMPPKSVDLEVNRIVSAVLKRGEGSVGSTKTQTWVSPSETDLRDVRRLGPQAIVSLSKLVDSPRPFVQLLAVRFLKEIGGPGVVEPLKRALGVDHWVVVRTQALTSLTSAPSATAIPIIRSAKADGDARVSARAKDLLISYYSLADE